MPDLPEGEKKTLVEIKEIMQDNSWKNDLTKEREQELIDELIEFRDTKQTGVRASNKSASGDINAICDRIAYEVRDRDGLEKIGMMRVVH